MSSFRTCLFTGTKVITSVHQFLIGIDLLNSTCYIDITKKNKPKIFPLVYYNNFEQRCKISQLIDYTVRLVLSGFMDKLKCYICFTDKKLDENISF